MLDLIYVHVDITSNAVLSKGITHHDFVSSVVHKPKNLLLLNPYEEAGEYERHSGLKIIREETGVEQFFFSAGRRRNNSEVKWMDFTDAAMLKELTPLEISELLYFGHTKTSLHSPFFYKLQNNFVFFEYADQMTRVYYRYIDEFYRILGNKISTAVLEKVNDKKSFFRRGISIDRMSSELLKEMRPILQEGVVFCFEDIEQKGKDYRIPIYMIEDSLWKTKNLVYKEAPLIASLVYNSGKRTWYFENNEESFSTQLPKHA